MGHPLLFSQAHEAGGRNRSGTARTQSHLGCQTSRVQPIKSAKVPKVPGRASFQEQGIQVYAELRHDMSSAIIPNMHSCLGHQCCGRWFNLQHHYKAGEPVRRQMTTQVNDEGCNTWPGQHRWRSKESYSIFFLNCGCRTHRTRLLIRWPEWGNKKIENDLFLNYPEDNDIYLVYTCTVLNVQRM